MPVEDKTASRRKVRSLRPLATLLPFVTRYKARMALAFIALTAAAIVTLLVPMAVKRIIDHGFSRDNVHLIDQYFGMMLIIVAALALASAARFYLVNWLGERVMVDLRSAVFSHLTKLSPSFFEMTRTGEVLSRLTADTTQIKSAFGVSAFVALRNLFLVVGATIMMVLTSAQLSGLVLLAIPLIVLPLVLFGRRVRRLSRNAQDTLAESAAMATENLQAMSTVQAFTREPSAREEFDQVTEISFVAARGRIVARAVLTATVIFVTAGSIVGVLWYGAQNVLSGEMTGGTLTQFVLYAAFSAGAMSSLSQVWGEVQLAAGSAERLVELLDTEPEIGVPENPATMVEPTRGQIAFKGIRFSYPTRREMAALDKLSFTVEPNETVAIVGPSGAGKTTLFNLLLRFYDPDDGIISIDGVEIANVSLASTRARMALVPQETVIFSSSMAENIRYGRPGASNHAVKNAAKAAMADQFIAQMPQGYDTRVGEFGVTLSGGQRQRIAIARAILRDAPILLLDEATSALDAESETHVQSALEGLMKGRTVLVIAHRFSTVRCADRILVMNEGKIVDEGQHTTLMKKGGLYARLARLQFMDGHSPGEVACTVQPNQAANDDRVKIQGLPETH